MTRNRITRHYSAELQTSSEVQNVDGSAKKANI